MKSDCCVANPQFLSLNSGSIVLDTCQSEFVKFLFHVLIQRSICSGVWDAVNASVRGRGCLF